MIQVRRGIHFLVGGARPGRMHLGAPPGGPLVPELHAAANAAAGLPDDTPAVEHWGSVTLAGSGQVGSDAGLLDVDGELTVRPRHRVGYLALAPGGPARPMRPFDDGPAPIRVVLGPDEADEGALARSFTVGRLGNRVGVRLEGPAASARAVGPSAPMVRGAIQVPPSGELIVLGPDHPTTGGYPVVAVVCSVDLGRLLCRAPGTPVDFAPIAVEEARRLRSMLRSSSWI